MTFIDENEDNDHGECDCDDCQPDETWKGECLDDHYSPFVNHLKDKGFTYLNSGSFRHVWERKGIVIKVPSVTDGLIDNRVEHEAYHKYFNGPTRRGVFLAPCRLLTNGCLMMKKLTWETMLERPKWAHLIDGRQVGPYKGRMVAYDYALDMTERFKWEREWKTESKFFNSLEWRNQRPHIDTYLSQVERRQQRKAG